MTRTDIIKHFVIKHNYKSYLEIGVQFSANNFDKIDVPKKIGVDPESGGTHRMTSDDFFLNNKEYFDIVFIDGLHYASQVLFDFNNSLKFLNSGGTIIIHDCSPRSALAQTIPRMSRQWNGDVWRAWVGITELFNNAYCIDTDEGCGIIEAIQETDLQLTNLCGLSYPDLEDNREALLKLRKSYE